MSVFSSLVKCYDLYVSLKQPCKIWLPVCQSRAALSVLAYAYYQMQDFVNASDCYEQLSTLHPEVEEYRLYYAQSLYKACLFQEAMKVACMIDQPQYQGQVGTPCNAIVLYPTVEPVF